MRTAIKGQSGLNILGILIPVIIFFAFITVIQSAIVNQTVDSNVLDEVLTFNSLASQNLAFGNLVSGTDVVTNASNAGQTFSSASDYTIVLGSFYQDGNITWLRNYTTNSTNTTAQVSSGGVVTQTHQAKNATFTAGTHQLVVRLFNASNSSFGTAVIAFNGNTVGNVTLPGSGLITTYNYTNISGAWFTANSRPVVTVTGSPGVWFSMNQSYLNTTGGERVFVDYTYTPPTKIGGMDSTIAYLVITFFVIGGVVLAAKGFGLL